MRQNGTVKVFQSTEGSGLITPDQGGKDVFVHITAVERSGIGPLDEGMRVSFETEPDKRGKYQRPSTCKWRNRVHPGACVTYRHTAGRESVDWPV
jgi:CspA family cold shock protein